MFLFGPWERAPLSPTLCYLSGGAMLAKFLLPSPVQLNSYCCCSTECWNLSSGNLDFYKCSFTCGHLSKSEPSRWFQTTVERNKSLFTSSCHFHCQHRGLSITWFTSAMDYTTLMETLSVMGECQVLVVKKRRKWRMANIVIMLMFKSSFSWRNLSKIGFMASYPLQIHVFECKWR